MSVSAISSSSPFASSTVPTNYQAAQSDFKALSGALQSNDLAGAQQDFAALQKDAPVFAQMLGQAQNAAAGSPLGDLKSLGSALQSNDLTGAQTAMGALKQDMSSTASVRHHHHHHHSSAGGSSTTPASSTSPAVSGVVSGVVTNPLA